MKAKDVMTPSPVTATPRSTLREVAALLIRHRISSVPVVDEDGRVAGIVTEADLFLKEKSIPFSGVRSLTLFNEWVGPEAVDGPRKDLDRYTAADVMSRNVICAEAEDEVRLVARMMVRNDVKRVPVLSHGKLVGMLTRHDLIRRIANGRNAEPQPA